MTLEIKQLKHKFATWLESFLMKFPAFTGKLHINFHDGKIKSVETWTKEIEQFRD